MSRCVFCNSKGECLPWCGESPEELWEQIETLQAEVHELEIKFKNEQKRADEFFDKYETLRMESFFETEKLTKIIRRNTEPYN